MAALTGAVMEIDSHQTIRVSMVMREIHDDNEEKAQLASLSPAEMASIQNQLERSIASDLQKHYSKDVSSKVAAQAAKDAAKILEADLARLLSIHAVDGESIVRVTFQRIIYNSKGMTTKAEQIKDPALYQEFYEKLSKAVFLEAHEI